MRTNDVNEQAERLDEKQRSAILKLIDLKTESDMDKILEKMDARFSSIDAKMNSIIVDMDAKFSNMDAKFSNMDAKFNGLREGLEHKIDGLSRLVYGVIIAFGIVFATTVLGFVFNYFLTRPH